MFLFILEKIIISLTIIVPLLIAVAFFTAAERKIMGSMQRRRGPNVVGFWGLLQPFADGLKLIVKESVVPSKANALLFILAPMITFILSIIGWTVIPFNLGTVYADINLGVLFIFAVSSLGVYGIIIAGWSSNSRYPFLGALRSAAQMISYEVAIGFVMVCVVLLSGSLNLTDIVCKQGTSTWFVFPLYPLFLIFLVSMLAETNRAPFDLPEAEAEIVAGYNLEYSSIVFALFFLGEYSSMILMSTLCVILFFGGWLLPFGSGYITYYFIPELVFSIKVVIVCFFFVWVRATVPRYRYDQLMALGWKIFLPFTLGFLFFVAGFAYIFNFLPITEILPYTDQLSIYYTDVVKVAERPLEYYMSVVVEEEKDIFIKLSLAHCDENVYLLSH